MSNKSHAKHICCCIAGHLGECAIHDSLVACIVLGWKTTHNIKYHLLIATITRPLRCHAVPQVSLQAYNVSRSPHIQGCRCCWSLSAGATERPDCRRIHTMSWHGSPLPLRMHDARHREKPLATSPLSSHSLPPHLLYILHKHVRTYLFI
jgi:hypothetical protein